MHDPAIVFLETTPAISQNPSHNRRHSRRNIYIHTIPSQRSSAFGHPTNTPSEARPETTYITASRHWGRGCSSPPAVQIKRDQRLIILFSTSSPSCCMYRFPLLSRLSTHSDCRRNSSKFDRMIRVCIPNSSQLTVTDRVRLGFLVSSLRFWRATYLQPHRTQGQQLHLLVPICFFFFESLKKPHSFLWANLTT
jgi:hypothetical protein